MFLADGQSRPVFCFFASSFPLNSSFATNLTQACCFSYFVPGYQRKRSPAILIISSRVSRFANRPINFSSLSFQVATSLWTNLPRLYPPKAFYPCLQESVLAPPVDSLPIIFHSSTIHTPHPRGKRVQRSFPYLLLLLYVEFVRPLADHESKQGP